MKQIEVLLVVLVVFSVLQILSPGTAVSWSGTNLCESTQYGWPFAAVETNTAVYSRSGHRVSSHEFILESAVANLIVCFYVSLQAVTFFLQMSRKRMTATLTELIGITLSIAVVASLYQSRDDLYYWSKTVIPLDLHWLVKGRSSPAYCVSDIVGCATIVVLVMILVDYTCFCATHFCKVINRPTK